MTDPNHRELPDEQGAGSAWPVLSSVQARILGCLIEKAITTPDQYPLTLNALVNACNQKSNRDPVMSLSESDVVAGLDGLRHDHRLAALVHTSGSRVEKYRHSISDVIKLNPEQAAILCELLLRGPETVGELRTRASRMHELRDLNHVQQLLDELATHPGGRLVVKLPREPGRRESRWMHLLCGEVDVESVVAAAPDTSMNDSSDLQQELAQLRAELESLKAEFAQFKQQFD